MANAMVDINDSQAASVWGVTLTFWILAILVVFIRIYSRTWLTKFRGQDDWWILAAVIFAAGDQTLKIIWLENGLGLHVEAVSMDQFTVFVKIGYVIALLYPWPIGLVKISILTFYLRLFPHETFRKCCYAMIAFVACMTVSISLAQIFACSPISDGWSLSPTTHCIDKAALQYAGSALSLATDVVILLMPMKYLINLTLGNSRRVGVIALFGLGILTCVASMVRLFTVHNFYVNDDPTWDATGIAIWSCLEINLAIIAASLPAIKPVIVRFFVNPIFKLFGIKLAATGATSKDSMPSYISTDMTSSVAKPQRAQQNDGMDLQPWRSAEESDHEGTPTSAREEMDFHTFLRNSGPEDLNGGNKANKSSRKKERVSSREREISSGSYSGSDDIV